MNLISFRHSNAPYITPPYSSESYIIPDFWVLSNFWVLSRSRNANSFWICGQVARAVNRFLQYTYTRFYSIHIIIRKIFLEQLYNYHGGDANYRNYGQIASPKIIELRVFQVWYRDSEYSSDCRHNCHWFLVSGNQCHPSLWGVACHLDSYVKTDTGVRSRKIFVGRAVQGQAEHETSTARMNHDAWCQRHDFLPETFHHQTGNRHYDPSQFSSMTVILVSKIKLKFLISSIIVNISTGIRFEKDDEFSIWERNSIRK